MDGFACDAMEDPLRTKPSRPRLIFERVLNVLVAAFDFGYRVRALVLVLDIGGDLPLVLFEQRQHRFDWRIALPKRQIGAVGGPLPVLDMERDDLVVIPLEVI